MPQTLHTAETLKALVLHGGDTGFPMGSRISSDKANMLHIKWKRIPWISDDLTPLCHNFSNFLHIVQIQKANTLCSLLPTGKKQEPSACTEFQN